MKPLATCLVFVTLTLSTNAIAESEDDGPLNRIYACATIADDVERLACFDASVATVKTEEEKGTFATITQNDANEMQKEAFGFSMPKISSFGLFKRSDQIVETDSDDDKLKRNKDGKIVKLEVNVTKIKRTAIKKLLITLENGQIWQQTDSNNIYISKKNPPQIAEISAGALGSYFMKLDNGRRFRAKRVK